MIYRKILVPVDDSKASLRALNEACDLAASSSLDTEVLAVNVVDITQMQWGAAEFANADTLRKAVQNAGGEVLAHASAVLSRSGVKHQTKILESGGEKVADVLLDEAADADCDLIIMGTHGFSGLMHLLMGSVAEGVLRKSPIPVLLIRHQDDD